MTPIIPDVVFLKPARFGDSRGWFTETYNKKRAVDAGIRTDFVQDNCSYSAKAGTVRGLHFQAPPHAQGKLVRCVRGAILDIIVDIRIGSPWYGQLEKAELTANGGEQLFVPRGFLHGFVTLCDDVEVAYKVDGFYDKASEGGVFWADEALALPWGIEVAQGHVSDKDSVLPRFRDFVSPFVYEAA
jgi:dTDP-4-dehydrorhamnose 3,5-epimerase